MPRSVRDARLDTRSARLKLSRQKEPHWRQISPGCHLGYYKGDVAGTWIARWRPLGHAAATARTGSALPTTSGTQTGSTSSASPRRRRRPGPGSTAWCARLPHSKGASGRRTVADAIDGYLDWYRREKGKADQAAGERGQPAHPAQLGTIQIERLTAKRIVAWRDALAEAAPRDRAGKPSRNRGGLEPEDAKRARRATANRTLTVLKAALHRAHEIHGVGSPAEWKRAKPFKGAGAARVRWLTEDEARRLLNASPGLPSPGPCRAGERLPLRRAERPCGSAISCQRDHRSSSV